MLAITPPMGFNTWNNFHDYFDEAMLRETADAFIDNGLLDAGYNYLVIDDCWSERDRDSVTGKINADKNKFPSGIKALSDYIHNKGLKFGMYSCAGIRTCMDYPGSYDHEFLDAETFAEYGCDLLKYDYCYVPDTANGQLLYHRMGMALKASGREILFSACNGGCFEDVNLWIRATGAHMFRSMGDIFDNFKSFRNIIQTQLPKLGSSAPGCFNDLDMLEAGIYWKGADGIACCDDIDYKTHFALWCMCGSPLMLGCDLRNINEATKKLVTNKELIRIDQDVEARPPFCGSIKHQNDDKKVLLKHLSNGEYAIGFFNMSDSDDYVSFLMDEFGVPVSTGYGFDMTDVFTGENIGVKKEFMRLFLKKHDCAVFRAKLVKR